MIVEVYSKIVCSEECWSKEIGIYVVLIPFLSLTNLLEDIRPVKLDITTHSFRANNSTKLLDLASRISQLCKCWSLSKYSREPFRSESTKDADSTTFYQTYNL